jgi:hypothetical protein
MLVKAQVNRYTHSYMFRINLSIFRAYACAWLKLLPSFVATLIFAWRFSFGSVPFWCLMFSCLWLESLCSVVGLFSSVVGRSVLAVFLLVFDVFVFVVGFVLFCGWVIDDSRQ